MTGPAPEPGGARWRGTAACVLIALGCLTAIPATVATWLNSVIVDTDGYIEAVGPLAADPAVQNAVTDRVIDRITNTIDASGPVADRLRRRVEEQVASTVASDLFATVWTDWRRRRARHAGVNRSAGDRTSSLHRLAPAHNRRGRGHGGFRLAR